MLMSLGLFTFGLSTAPFETLKRTTAQRWEAKNRVGRMAAQQWVGPGEDAITLEGTLMPELTGGPESLDKLRDMAASGKAWILTAGTGENMGRWIIAQVEESRSAMLGNGFPRKIGFSLSLRAYDDDDPASLGNLMDSRP
ncbi:Phage P2 GpU protein [uncultured Alphaproteobacteria bacterium]|uniref:Phage P2 GpU protein n=1 Tax=uncultured Alphaproteobacteria bacterium TaxID=91750 RepID=A0A212J3T6_9PROT|nr:Phage P2 GpU protein [uncultured Alphaproteobacteria bacterium]